MKPRLTGISLFTIVSFSLQFLAARANWEFTREGVEYQRLLRVRVRQGSIAMETISSHEGVASTQYERDLDGKLIPVRGAITNYDENSVFGLDYGRKTYISMSLDEATRRAQPLVRATDGEIQGPKVVCTRDV